MKKILAILIICVLFAISAYAINITKQGKLDSFVKPTSEGGWGLPAYIISTMTENRSYSHGEIYQTIQADSTLANDIHQLTNRDVQVIFNWMLERETFIVSGDTITIITGESDIITYNPEGIIEY